MWLLLENGADVNTQLDGRYGSELAAAAFTDNEAIVRLLLRRVRILMHCWAENSAAH